MSHVRWLTIGALAALALALAWLLGGLESARPDATAAALAADPTGASGAAQSMERRDLGSDPLVARHGEPWPGLEGDWMYRCPVRLRLDGALEDTSVLVQGPGLPHAGWHCDTDATGAVLVPELAVGQTYSFTLGPGLFLVPLMGYTITGPGAFSTEVYSPPGPDGAHRTMQIACRVTHGRERVRLLDDRDGRLLVGAQVRAVDEHGEPVALADGAAEWTATDGTIPLPLPTRSYDVDPDLEVVAAEGAKFDLLPLGPAALAEALETGALRLGGGVEWPLVHLKIYSARGAPAENARVSARDGRTVAAAGPEGIVLFQAPGPEFTIGAPGHLEASYLTSEWGTASADSPPRAVHLEIASSWTIGLASGDTRAVSVMLRSETALRITGPSRRLTRGSSKGVTHELQGIWPSTGVHVSARGECEVEAIFAVWQEPVERIKLRLQPGRPEITTWTPPAAVGGPLPFRIVDEAGAAVNRAQIWIGQRGEDIRMPLRLLRPLPLEQRWKDEWSLPPWPDGLTPALRVAAPGRIGRMMTARELLDAGGVIVLPSARSFRVHVMDEGGQPVADASLRLGSSGCGFGTVGPDWEIELLDDVAAPSRTRVRALEVLDADGLVALVVEARGFEPFYERHDPARGDLTVTLRRGAGR